MAITIHIKAQESNFQVFFDSSSLSFLLISFTQAYTSIPKHIAAIENRKYSLTL